MNRRGFLGLFGQSLSVMAIASVLKFSEPIDTSKWNVSYDAIDIYRSDFGTLDLPAADQIATDREFTTGYRYDGQTRKWIEDKVAIRCREAYSLS